MIKRIVCYGFFVLLLCVMFGRFFGGDAVLFTTDAAIKGSNVSLSEVLHRLAPHWSDNPLLGSPRGTGTQLANLLKAFFTGVIWNNVAYGLACLLASWAFLKRFRFLTPWSAVMGALAAFWLGTNFSILMAGHFYKPYVVLFFVCSLIPVSGAAAGSIAFAVIWGGCVGLMFAQQPDVALFFALFAGAYLVFQLWKEQRFKLRVWLKVLLPAVVVAFLFAAGPLLSGYEHHVKGTVQMQTKDPQQKWDYVTQWSVPPNEVIDFVAPGYYGWRSGEPEGPYWGRTGRSPGWEKTKQGFQNFKLESTYIGFIPFGFAIFALFVCRRSKHKAEILFWAGATLVSLLLAFGKYFPLYSLFYKLPVVSDIRNPNKFIQVFQVCLAILAIYGLDALWRSREADGADGDKSKPVRAFFWSSVGAVTILGLWALIATLGQDAGTERFVSEGWPREAAETMVQNKALSLWYADSMAAVVAAVFAVFSFIKLDALVRYRNAILALLVLVVAADAIRLSKHYIKEMPRSYIAANALTDFLEKNLGDQRVALLSQDGINNIWINYLMPYNGIACFNFTDMPRMANDYKTFLSAGQRDPLNMWRFSAVKYLLAPANAEKQLSAAGCKKVFTYGLAGADADGFKVVSHPSGSYAVYELQRALPRYALFAGARKGTDHDALAGMSDFSTVILPEDSPIAILDGVGQTGSIEVLSSREGKVRLHASSDVPVILRAANWFDRDWKAKVDGVATAVERVDFLCQGVYLAPGEHDVVLRYAPSCRYFYMQLLGFSALIGALGLVWRRRRGANASY